MRVWRWYVCEEGVEVEVCEGVVCEGVEVCKGVEV